MKSRFYRTILQSILTGSWIFCTMQFSIDGAAPATTADLIQQQSKDITEGTIWDILVHNSVFFHWQRHKSSCPSSAVVSHERCLSQPNSSFALILPWARTELLHSLSSTRWTILSQCCLKHPHLLCTKEKTQALSHCFSKLHLHKQPEWYAWICIPKL